MGYQRLVVPEDVDENDWPGEEYKYVVRVVLSTTSDEFGGSLFAYGWLTVIRLHV